MTANTPVSLVNVLLGAIIILACIGISIILMSTKRRACREKDETFTARPSSRLY